MKESLARVHVHELSSPEERPLPEAANDNVESIPTHPFAANDDEKVQPILTTYPEAANDNIAIDNAKLAELRERLGLKNEKETPMEAPTEVDEIEPLQEVPLPVPMELEQSMSEASIETATGHAETAETGLEEVRPAQAAVAQLVVEEAGMRDKQMPAVEAVL